MTATPTTSEQITLKNNSSSSINITDWTLGDLNDPTAYSMPNDTYISINEKNQYLGQL